MLQTQGHQRNLNFREPFHELAARRTTRITTEAGNFSRNARDTRHCGVGASPSDWQAMASSLGFDDWDSLGEGNYRRSEVYAMEWEGVPISGSSIVAAAHFAGPVACLRADRKLAAIRGVSTTQFIFIYTSSGRRITEVNLRHRVGGCPARSAASRSLAWIYILCEVLLLCWTRAPAPLPHYLTPPPSPPLFPPPPLLRSLGPRRVRSWRMA